MENKRVLRIRGQPRHVKRLNFLVSALGCGRKGKSKFKCTMQEINFKMTVVIKRYAHHICVM